MQVTSGIQCNLLSPSYSTVYAPQGDAKSRFVLIQLLEGAAPWEVPAGASVIIRAAKPDGTFCFYDTNEAGESAYSVSGSTVTIELVGQVLAAPGPVLMQIDFYNTAGAHLSTFNFCCQVSESVVADDDIVSSNYFSVLTATLTEMLQIEQAVKAAYGAPLVAATAAAMTDHTRVYVYTGSESGYTNGNWYYWNGTAWASGGVYNSSAVNVDSAPTQGSTNPVSSGGTYTAIANEAAAREDADTALGDELDDVKSAIGYSETNVFDASTIKSNNNSAVTNNGDGTYTYGTTDYGNTVFGESTLIPAGEYILFGSPFGTTYIMRASDSVRIVTNDTGAPKNVTIEESVNCLLGLQILSAETPTQQFVLTPFLKKESSRFDAMQAEIDELDNRVSNIEDGATDISADITYQLGHYIKPNGTIGDLASCAISNLITLGAGYTISIYANGGTADTVSMLSSWSSDGNTFIKNLHTCQGDVYETIEYTAETETYLKICYLSSRGTPVVKLIKPQLTALAQEIGELKDNTSNLFADISMFDDIAVCGDSYTSGEIYSSDALIGANEKTRWGTVLSRMTGANVTTYASGGADTNTWQSRAGCLPQLLLDNPHELYVLCLGINDRTYVTLGTIADIHEDYTQNPNTFYGNYGKIIAQIRAHAPNAKIILSKVFIVTLQTGAYYRWSSEAIEEIANYFGIPCIDTADADFFSSGWFDNNMRRGHPIAPTYTGIAKAMKYLISKCILESTSYFSDYYPN